ncbi:MAG TPA: hypothetical protein VMU06_20400 [Stellaceae bacterium]|nr:hypothetical protein [Stellaceae bacterium]
MRLRGLALAAVIWVSAAPTALADEVWDTFTKLGLPGRWASDCSQPPSPQDPYLTYYLDADKTLRRIDIGNPAEHPITRIEAVMISQDGLLTVRERLWTGWGQYDGTVLELVIAYEGRRHRTLSSKGSDGKVHIKDGVVQSTGKASPWLYRCEAGPGS